MFGAIVATMLAAGAPQSTSQLLNAEARLDEACRDGSAENEAAWKRTEQICARREAVGRQLQGRGLCWGPDDAVEAEKRWMKVGPRCHN